MERTIRVTGRGKISVKPDTIRLKISLEGISKTYDQTLKMSAVDIEILKDCFEDIGFQRNDLKTLLFNVDTEYESYKDENKEWKSRFVGYKYSHDLKLEFDSDNKKLGQVIYAMAHCSVHPEFKIIYTVKDMEKAKNELLHKAIIDSREKAEVLTKASGVTLGQVLTIDYSWGEIDIISTPMERMVRYTDEEYSCGTGYDMDIEPDDIDVSDTVTVLWNLV